MKTLRTYPTITVTGCCRICGATFVAEREFEFQYECDEYDDLCEDHRWVEVDYDPALVAAESGAAYEALLDCRYEREHGQWEDDR